MDKNVGCFEFYSRFFVFWFTLDVEFFSTSLEKYKNEHQLAVAVPDKKPIGMILVDARRMKEVLIPSPLKCLEVREYSACL